MNLIAKQTVQPNISAPWVHTTYALIERADGGHDPAPVQRPFRVDEWLLYSIESPSASGARALSRGPQEIFRHMAP